ncbi:MAG: hypothetical protein R3E89_13360 [Thiolinea sp.]
MQFGWSADEAMSWRVLDAYVGRGGNFIDTADCYSAWSSALGGPANAGGGIGRDNRALARRAWQPL